MRQSIELHDSVLRCAEMSGNVLTLHFSKAYVHRSTGEPGVDPGDGLVQAAIVSFGGASFVGALEHLTGPIWDGNLTVSGKRYVLLPVPLIQEGEVRAEFLLNAGPTLSVVASSVHCQLLGSPRFVEQYAG